MNSKLTCRQVLRAGSAILALPWMESLARGQSGQSMLDRMKERLAVRIPTEAGCGSTVTGGCGTVAGTNGTPMIQHPTSFSRGVSILNGRHRRVVIALVLIALCAFAGSTDADDYVPQPGIFPPDVAGTYIAGELVYIDPVNRRGGIRLDGNAPGNRYHAGPLHYFALLPYAVVWHNGSLAEIRDIPIGTHVHGCFFVPPKGEEDTIPSLPEDQKRFTIKHNHAISLEDDFSFYQRRGQAWKVVSIDIEKEKINVEPIVDPPKHPGAQRLIPGSGGPGKLVKDGINVPFTFDIDYRTHVWKGRRMSDLSDIQPGTMVQLNLEWGQGWGQGEFRVGDIWLDAESRDYATEFQRRRHVRYERQRWSPGWIDHIEAFDFGGGIVTLTLFHVDQTIIDDFRKEKDDRIAVAVAEKTLRTWFHRADRKFCKLVEWKEVKEPPLGSSGIQLKLKFVELLAGYVPGNCVRVKCDSWKFVTMPPEERITSRAEQERGAKMVLPW